MRCLLYPSNLVCSQPSTAHSQSRAVVRQSRDSRTSIQTSQNDSGRRSPRCLLLSSDVRSSIQLPRSQLTAAQGPATMTELKKYLSTLPEFSTTSSRLSFLYSSLAPRKSANPTGFSSAIGWWRLLLLDLVAKGHLGEDKLILVADDTLREALRWDKIGRPSSLGTILVRC